MSTPVDDRLQRYLTNTTRPTSRPFDEQTLIPPAWRALGYLPAEQNFAHAHALRQHWLDDLESGGASHFAPRPDVVIISGATREPLPGWTHEVIADWLVEHGAAKNWTPPEVSYDRRVLALLTSNRDMGLPIGTALPDALPLVTLGYDAAAAYVTGLGLTGPKGSPVSMGASYMRRAWMNDINRGYQALAPVPDVIISHGSGRTQIPGWTEATLKEWPTNRQTPGNWSYGDQRATRKRKEPAGA